MGLSEMTNRERKYFKRKEKKSVNYGFYITSHKVSPEAYDGKKYMQANADELFSNFGLLMPTKAIKLPTKKEIKERLYGRNSKRWKQRMAISPATCFIKTTTYKEYMESVWRKPKWTIDARTFKGLEIHKP